MPSSKRVSVAVLFAFALFFSFASSGPVRAASLWSAGDGVAGLDRSVLDLLLNGEVHEFSIRAGGREHSVRVSSVATSASGIRSLSGTLAGDPESFFLLCSAADGATTAFFHPAGDASYRLQWSGDAYRIVELEAEAFTPCAGAIAAPEPPPARASSQPATRPLVRGDRAVADDGSRHDVMIAYTPKASWGAGGDSFVEAEIQLAVDAANLVYANSGVSSTLRLVYSTGTDYDEDTAWSYLDYLSALYHPADGKMDELHPRRSRTGADFLVLIVENIDIFGDPLFGCGVGYVMQPNEIGPQFEHLALSVVTRSCASSVWTLAHELGHNRGCAHNREDANVDGAYPYAYGHRFTGDNGQDYRTVMSYDTEPPSITRIPHFSNPDNDYFGTPTGVPVGQAGEAHCTLAQNNTAAACALFRPEHTFIDFDWSGESDGLFNRPYPSIEEGLLGSRDGGYLAMRGDLLTYTGVWPVDRRVYTHDGNGSTTIGSP